MTTLMMRPLSKIITSVKVYTRFPATRFIYCSHIRLLHSPGTVVKVLDLDLIFLFRSNFFIRLSYTLLQNFTSVCVKRIGLGIVS